MLSSVFSSSNPKFIFVIYSESQYSQIRKISQYVNITVFHFSDEQLFQANEVGERAEIVDHGATNVKRCQVGKAGERAEVADWRCGEWIANSQ
jgi:hypothetical protein